MLRVQAVHVHVPWAHVVADGHVTRGVFGAQHRAVGINRLPRYAAQYVYAEFKPHRVNCVGQRLKACAALSRGEAVLSGHLAAVLVHAELGQVAVLGALCARLAPFDVHGHVLPAVYFKVVSHEARVGQHLVLAHARAVAVPAVPTHRRGLQKRIAHYSALTFAKYNRGGRAAVVIESITQMPAQVNAVRAYCGRYNYSPV